MKKLFITTIACTILFTSNIFAQEQPIDQEGQMPTRKERMRPDFKSPKGGNKDRHSRNGNNRPEGRPGRMEQGLQQVAIFKGKITNKLSNNDFTFDRFQLEADGQTYNVKFPKQLGQEIQNMGNNVTVKGIARVNREGTQEIKFVSIESGNKIVYNTKPHRMMQPQENKMVTNKGKVSDFRINDRGEVDGLILNSNTIVNVPKNVLKQLYSMVQKGNEIAYTGYIKGARDGEVQLEKYTIVKPMTITVNGIEYLL